MKRLLFFVVLLTLTAAGRADAQAGRRAEARAGSISGRVATDTGQPMLNAVVRALAVGKPTGQALRINTGEDGRFNFDNLPPGTYRIVPTANGYYNPLNLGEQKYYRLGDYIDFVMMKGGVITGEVTNSAGEPVVAVQVRAIRLRELDGKPARYTSAPRERATDDRGVYRIYGLEPGIYLVMATGQAGPGSQLRSTGYEEDAPTYYPSATRDGAARVTVHESEEVTNIDIRYRNERGRTISGVVSGAFTGATPAESGASVSLARASTGAIEADVFVGRDNARSFTISGLGDGEYYLKASRYSSVNDGGVASPAIRMKVNGADVTGLELKLAPLASISGRVLMQSGPPGQKPKCESKRDSSVEEIVITARRDEKREAKDQPPPDPFLSLMSAPDDKGAFALRNLEAGRYRLEFRFPDENWFARAVTLPASPQARQPINAARDGLEIKPGERVTNLTVAVAEGAAQLRGRVVAAQLNSRLPDRLRLLLIPADKDSADDPLRFYEKDLDADSSFSLSNLAPGRYFVMARQYAEEEAGDRNRRPWGWDAEMRKSLRQEAESANVIVELEACRRVTDYALRLKPPVTGTMPNKIP
jgi:hypothetical protein